MCPLCMSGAILMVTSVLSAGGLTAFAAKKFAVPGKGSGVTNNAKGGNNASHSNTK